MTILRPTSEAAGAGSQGVLPDELLLNQLAGEFFSHVVTQAGTQPSRPPLIQPQASDSAYRPTVAAIGAGQPGAVAPYPAAASAVQPLQAGPPAAAGVGTTGTGEGSGGAPLGGDPLDGLARAALDDRISAQSHGLPGQEQLQVWVKELLVPDAPVKVPHWDQQSRFDHGSFGHAGIRPAFDLHAVRRDFPILSERVNGKPLAWLDNAATTHKPQSVIDRLSYFYAHENSNIHRAAHELAARATDAYEAARQKSARFLGAASPDEIIFVRGATEAINLVANTYGEKFIGEGDEIIVSLLEHHANIVPWQQLAQRKGAKLRVIPVDDSGQLLLDEYRKLLNARTKLVAVTQVSNALGTVTPVAEIVALAHQAGVHVLVDGAQAVSHMRVNVLALDADFYVFSGHKVFGPTGIGVVYGKASLLAQLPPWQGGGNMIADVTFERTLYQDAPARFEAGTGNIADAVGLGAAIDYVERLGMENIAAYEHALLEYGTWQLNDIPGVRLIGTAKEKASVLSFVLDGFATEEVGKALNEEGIAVRSGHHCAQPILRRFGLEATVRPSLAFYNTTEEVDRLVSVVRRLACGRKF